MGRVASAPCAAAAQRNGKDAIGRGQPSLRIKAVVKDGVGADCHVLDLRVRGR